jgi:thiamine pyrophosphate-dependent acetolactate synthase large subunit-like protein
LKRNVVANLRTFTAFRNQTPLVITAGQQARAMLALEPYLSATDAPVFPKPYVKWNCEPARAQDVPAAIARTYYLATLKPCGPTFVSIPVDDWEVEAEPFPPRQVSFEFAPDPHALQQIADALNRSEHPALIVGPGVDRDGAWEAAIALADPSHRVMCLLGDGSSLYSIQALCTAAQHHLPITVLILNNQEYAALKAFGKLFETGDFAGVDLPGITFAAIANGFGCPAVRVEKAEDLAGALTNALAGAGPMLLDVQVDPAVPMSHKSPRQAA